MTPEKLAKLENLRNHSTLYEAILSHGDDSRSFRLGYTKKSGLALLRLVHRRAEEIVQLTKNPETAIIASARSSVTLSDGWTAHFTGRTEREAILEGELTSILVASPRPAGTTSC